MTIPTAPIIGSHTHEQLVDNLGASAVRMEASDFERIDALVPPMGYALRYYDGAGYADFRAHSARSLV